MTNSNEQPGPLVVDQKQAKLLKTGFGSVGINGIPAIPELNATLTRGIQQENDEILIPEPLYSTARAVAMLVIKAELGNTEGMMSSGQMRQLDIRTGSEYGLYAKLRALETVILHGVQLEPSKYK